MNDTSSPSQVRTMPARRGRGGVGIAILLVLLVGAAIGAVLVLRSRGDETATTPAGSNDKSAASRDGSTTMPSKAEAKPDAQAGSAPSAGSALAANPTKPKLKPKPAPKPHVAVPVPVPGQSNGFVRLDADVPCIVVVDDVPTSKVTPVDALALAPGAHRVRLVNDDYGIDYPIDVVVKPNAGEEIVVTFLEDGR